jgi:hypothetical protein
MKTLTFCTSMLLLCAGGCTEAEPLYCDGETPCKEAGYICDYEHRRCVAAGDGAATDRGQPDTLSADRAAPDTTGGPDAAAGTGAR